MGINERLFATMKSKKITQEQLANALKTTQSVVAGWKNRGTIPTMEHLPTICEILGVSWEYLITGEESTMYTTPDEDEMILKFRMLPDEAQKEIKSYLDFQLFKIKNKGE